MIKSCHGCLKIYGKQREAQRKSNYFLCCLGSSMPLMRKRIEVGWKRRKWVWSGAMIRQQWSLCPAWLLNQSQVSSRWVITRADYCCAGLTLAHSRPVLGIFVTVWDSFFQKWIVYILSWSEIVLKIVNLSFWQPLAPPPRENNSINRNLVSTWIKLAVKKAFRLWKCLLPPFWPFCGIKTKFYLKLNGKEMIEL